MLTSQSTRRIYTFGDFELQVGARLLLRTGERVAIGSKAFEVLTCLVLQAGEVVTKEHLLKTVWPNSFVEESNLAQHVFALRKALGDRADLIATIPGRGYQFTGVVQEWPPIRPAAEFSRQSDEIVVQTMRERSHTIIEERTTLIVSDSSSSGIAPTASQLGSSRIAWVGGVVLCVAVASAALVLRARSRATGASELRSSVVADFLNTTGDESFDRTLKRALEIDLGQSPTLSVMSGGEAVGLRQTMGQNAEAPLTGEAAREVCVRGGRQVLFSGAIAKVGASYLLTLEANDCNSGKKLANAKAQASSKESVLTALDTIADRVREKLGESAPSLDAYAVPIRQATTPSLDALKAYSMGQYLDFQGKDETEFIGFYKRAVELDPNFAMAWGALANTYYNLNEFNLASENYKRAYQLSGRATAHERMALRSHYFGEGIGDMVEAVRSYEVWAATYPQDVAPLINICNGYTQIGQFTEAIPACRRGLSLAPERAVAYSVYIRALKCANRLDEASQIGRQAADHGKDSTGVHSSLYQIAIAQHDAVAIARETDWAKAHSDAWYRWYFPLSEAFVAAATGRYKEATELFRHAYDAAMTQNLTESARDILVAQAQTEDQLGLRAAARATLARIAPTPAEPENIALTRSELGDASDAERFIAQHRADPTPGTKLAFVTLPSVRATQALEHGKPLEAIDALEPATPYELADYSVPTLRAKAYLKAGQPRKAIAEYRKIAGNPAIDAVSPLLALAHLGLARAEAMAGEQQDSAMEYDTFLAIWKDADPAMPLLKAAKQELAKLPR